MAHTLAHDLDGAELRRIGVRPSPLARRALSDARHVHLHAMIDDLLASGADRALESVLQHEPALRP